MLNFFNLSKQMTDEHVGHGVSPSRDLQCYIENKYITHQKYLNKNQS